MPASSGSAAAAWVEEARHDRRDAGRAGHGQALDDGRREDRGVVVARHGAVAPRPADRDAIGGEALLGDLDRVEPAPGDGRRDAAAFVEGAGRPEPFGPVLGDPFRAGQATRLLVGRAREEDIAAEPGDRVAGRIEAGRPRLGGQLAHDAELHRDHRLHVDRAAPVDVAVADVGGERIVRPAFGGSRHDVEVRQEEQWIAAGAIAAQADVHRAATRVRFDDLGLEAGLGQPGRDEACDAQLPVRGVGWRRIDRWDPDELAERLHETLGRERPGRTGDRARRGGDRTHRGALPVAMVSATPMMKPPNMSAATMATSSLP